MATRWIVLAALGAVAVAAAAVIWRTSGDPAPPPGFVRAEARLVAGEIRIASAIAGRVEDLPVGPGQTVGAGDVVAKIDHAALAAKLDAAQDQMQAVRRQHVLAYSAVEKYHDQCALALRARAGGDQGPASDQNRGRSRSREQCEADLNALAAADKAMDQTAHRLEQLKLAVKNSLLTAPVAARVVSHHVPAGASVSPGEEIVTLADLSDIHLAANLPCQVAASLTIGSEARFIDIARPDRPPLAAVVTFITPGARDQATAGGNGTTTCLPIRLALRDPLPVDLTIGSVGSLYLRVDDRVSWPENFAR